LHEKANHFSYFPALPTDASAIMKTTRSESFAFAPIIAVSVHDTRMGMEVPSAGKPSPAASWRSLSYDVLALGPIAEETLWDGRQAMREEWVLCDSILSLQREPARRIHHSPW
jgi:hypothetical protein